MKTIGQIISWASLVVMIVPSVLFMIGRMGLDQVKLIMLITTIVWFVVTPFWMEREKAPEEKTETTS